MTSQQNDAAADRVQELLVAGRPQEALDLCRQLCRAEDPQPEDWLLYGCLSADVGEVDTARSALTEATRLAPDFVEAWFALGKLLVAAGDPAAALTHFEKASELEPDNPDIWLALGIAHGLLKQPAEAERYCRQSLTLAADSAQARFNLANALQAQGKLAEAETEYEAALRIEPEFAAAWSMLAQARVGLRRLDDAEAAATRALRLNPNMGEAHFTLGAISGALGDKQQARDHFREAARLLPGFIDAKWRLGVAHLGLKEFAAAVDCFQAVVDAEPTSAKAHAAMGDCFYQQKIYARAEDCFRKSLALNDDNIDVHLGLAFSLKGLDRNEEYEQQLVECLRIDPDEVQVKHLLATLRGETTATAPAQYVKNVFDGYADHFDEHLVGALQYRTPQRLFEMVSEHSELVADSAEIIDLGCGTGLCAPLFRGLARSLHGVDLSPRMIEKARERNLYDSLEVGDVAASLNAKRAAWDVAISADVFVYIGDLREIFSACFAALKPGGLFVFSVEAGDDCEAFVLRSTGRYAHASSYIRSLSDAAGFEEVERRATVLRKEGNQDMHGHLFLLRRPAAATA